MTANSISIPKQKYFRKRSLKKSLASDTSIEQPVSLNFDTLRIFNANQNAPVEQILFNASYTEEFSFEPTVKVELKGFTPEMQKGETLMNKVGKRDFFKTQVIMLFSIATLGLLIGFFIAYFI